jgi:hypothetical protein
MPTHVLFVRPGTRPVMLAWPPRRRELPGLLGAGRPCRTGAASDDVVGDHQYK